MLPPVNYATVLMLYANNFAVSNTRIEYDKQVITTYPEHLLEEAKPNLIVTQVTQTTLCQTQALNAFKNAYRKHTRQAKQHMDQSPGTQHIDANDPTIRFLNILATNMVIEDQLRPHENTINAALESGTPVTITVQQFTQKPVASTVSQRIGNAGIAVIKGIRSFLGV